ncbi:putative MFS transporter, partial [Hortaea werneckii]
TATWLTPEEKDLAGARVKSERLGATEVLDKVDSKKTLRGIFSPVTLATAFIFLLNNITVQGLTFFAPTIVRTIYPDATVVSQQLHTVPPYVVGSFFCLALSMLSSRIDNRLYIFIGSAPMVMVGYTMYIATSTREPQTRYVASFLIAVGAFSFGSLCNAQVSANVVSDTARSSAIGTNVMMGNIGGLIATWSFLPSDGPEYPIGNGLNLAAATLILICSMTLLFWMRVDNKRRAGRDVDAELDGLDEGQIQRLDWKHPAFEWRP